MRRVTSALSICVALGACGDNTIDSPDASIAAPFATAPHAPMPSVLHHNNTVIANLRLVTLAFDGYDAAGVSRFADAVVASSWYSTVGSEYGIRPGTHLPTVSLGPAPSSLTRDGVTELVKQVLTDNRAPRPAEGNTQLLYMVFVPASVVAGDGLTGGRAFHHATMFNRGRLPIVTVLDDGRGPEANSVPAARALINAVTNPYSPPNDGYYADPPPGDPWSLVRRELADLCDGEQPITEGNLELPQVYSDVAAKAGKSPCKPAGPNDGWSDVSAVPSSMRTIPRGSSITFTLTGWSTEEVPDWEIRTRAADFSELTEEEMQPVLSDRTINNNTMVHLTLHAPPTAQSGASGGVYVLSGASAHPWAVGFFVR